jgi:tRNA(Ile)-lysidine synthase
MPNIMPQAALVSITDQLQLFCRERDDLQRLVVAYSGGLDSMVLLHGLVTLRDAGLENRPILAVHVNHQLSDNSDQWQQHCETVCQHFSVPLQVSKVVIQLAGKGLENAAREQRYQVFEGIMQPGDGLMLAHHQDDQAETLLLRLMRGAGPKGLAAMTPERSFGHGILLRPLLTLPRSALEAWASHHQLAWVEDESNHSLDFDRNYLRHEIMPLLQQRWPNFSARWQQAAELCREADREIEATASQDLSQVDLRSERWGWSVNTVDLDTWSDFRRGNLLRCLLQKLKLSAPDKSHLQQVEQQIFSAYEDASSDVCWGNVSIRRFRQRMYILPLTQALQAPHRGLQWDGQQSLEWKGGQLMCWPVESGGLYWPQGMVVDVGVRQGGERCKPAGKVHSQKLKKLLLEFELEAWLRDVVPILRYNGAIVAVGDLWICDEFKAGPDQPGCRLVWQQSHSV